MRVVHEQLLCDFLGTGREYGSTPLEEVSLGRLASAQVIRGGVFVELPDSFWRLRDTSEVRLAKPILLLMGIAHWVASCLFSFGAWIVAIHQQIFTRFSPLCLCKEDVMGKLDVPSKWLHMFRRFE